MNGGLVLFQTLLAVHLEAKQRHERAAEAVGQHICKRKSDSVCLPQRDRFEAVCAKRRECAQKAGRKEGS